MNFTQAHSILVPNVLGTRPDEVERLFQLPTYISRNHPLILEMSSVQWIHPYGATSLLGVCNYLSSLTHEPVCLSGFQRHIHTYLRRINFFSYNNYVYTIDRFDPADDFARSPSSSSVLELLPIHTFQDAYQFAERGRTILSTWWGNTTNDVNSVVTLLSEACGNIVDHSGKSGTAMIQKYEREYATDIELAISDLGLGIRHSLQTQHPTLSTTCSDFIQKAMDGWSARSETQIGTGLGNIERIATTSGGSLHIRSEQGSIRTTTSGRVASDNLSFFPGTHIAITFRCSAAR